MKILRKIKIVRRQERIKLNNSNFVEAQDIEDLLNLQEYIKKVGINEENVSKIVNNLTEKQKEELKNLYISQIEELNCSINKYKNDIEKIKKKIN